MATTPKTLAFHVALDGVKLAAADKAALSKAINAAALREIARLDLADGLHARIPKEWLGIWIDRLKIVRAATGADAGPALPPGLADATVASVVLEGVKLSSTQRAAVDAAIRTAALAELGRIGPREGLSMRYPKEWLGIWIGPYGKLLG